MVSHSPTTVWETKLPLPLVHRGKVRDIYAVGQDKLLMVTTDRLSAFDVVLPSPIPDKGKVLNQLSLFWFEKLAGLAANHVLTADLEKMGLPKSLLDEFGESLSGRSVLVHRAEPLPVECVVRGFLAGSGWKDYLSTGQVCGHPLPDGLRQCQELPAPIFTPATKAREGHDLNIDFEQARHLIGHGTAERIRALSLKLYQTGLAFAKTRGILIADTKFEFGIFQGQLLLIDEALTPDSSRFWPSRDYRSGQDQPSLDKQIVRNFLLGSGWNMAPPAPVLPQEIVDRACQAYKDVFLQLTGRALI